MDLKKLWIEGAVYPAMTLLKHNHVVANTRALQRTETLPAAERAVRTRQRLSELLSLCKTQVPAYSDLPFTDLDIRREPLDCLQAVDPMTWTPVNPGEKGLLAVTDLVGETMPHLRVILNYMARWSESPCPCGRTMPVLEDLEAMAPSE